MAASERQPLLDSNKQHLPAKKSTLLTVCPYILGNELCERLAYYGLATNLVTYITRVMGGDPAFAAILVAIFEGTCYTTPIIGALLADSMWGRYKTIMVFSIIYLCGIVMLTVSSMVPDSDEDAETANPLQFGLLFASLAVISLGTGGIKPNVSAFGADQFNEADPRDRREKESFFNWFYLAVNVGSLIASIVIVYIQDSVSWTLGFAIPGAAMALAIGLFWAGRGGYRHVTPTESPMARVVRVVAAATRNRWKKAHPDSMANAPRVVAVGADAVDGEAPPDIASFHGSRLYQQAVKRGQAGNGTDSGAAAPGGGMNGGELGRSDSMLQMPLTASMSYRWLEDAVTEWQTSQGQVVSMGGLAGYTPKQVEEVKLVLRLLPVFAATVLYWTIYTQMGTLFVQQGTLMARDLTWRGQTLTIPSASMSTFNTLSIIVLIYVYDKWFEPALKRSPRFRMTLLRRQGWGMVVAALAMLYAGGIEAWRLAAFHAPSNAAASPCPPECAGGLPFALDPNATFVSTAGRSLLGAGPSGMGTWGGWPAAGARELLGLGGGGVGGDGSNSAGAECASLCGSSRSDLSIFWQAPSYFLIGLSEVFTSIGQLEFFYDQAPDVMRSCSMALCLLSTAMGSYSAGALTALVQSGSKAVFGTEWLPRDLNAGHMDYFFYFLAGLMVLNLAAFLWVALRYEYKAVEHKRHVHAEDAEAMAVAVAAGAGYAPPALPPLPPGVVVASGGAGSTTAVSGSVGTGGLPYVVGSGPQYARLPGGSTTMPIGIGLRSASAPLPAGTSRLGAAAGEEEEGGPNLEIYSRSLAYVPASPNIPAPFR